MTSWTQAHEAHQAPLSIEFPRQEYWNGLVSRGSSPPRDWTYVSCIRRQVLYHWVTKEAHSINIFYYIYDGGVGADLELHPVNKREVIRLLDREPHHHSSAQGCIIRWPAQRPRSGERKSLQPPLNFSYAYVSFERVIQLFLLEREESKWCGTQISFTT